MGSEVATFVVAWVIHVLCLVGMYILLKVSKDDESAKAFATLLVVALGTLWFCVAYFPWAE